MPDLSPSVTAAADPKAGRSLKAVVALLGASGVVVVGIGGTSAPPPPSQPPFQAVASAQSDGFEHIPIGDMECTLCHNPATMDTATWTFTLELPGGLAERTATVPHDKHEQLGCVTCHGRPPNPVQEDFTCAWTCHAAHLQAPEIDCRVCHEPPPQWAHEYSVVHQGCTGGVCHSLPIQDSLPWRRPLCMVCHQDLDVYIPEVPPAGMAADTLLPADAILPADTTAVADTTTRVTKRTGVVTRESAP